VGASGRRVVRFSLGVVICVLAAGLALLHAGESEAAGPPMPSEAIVLGFEPAEAFFGERTSDRCPAGEGRVQVFYADGRPAGTALFCLVRVINAPYIVYWSAVITVNLAGGSVTATIGTSLTFGDGLPHYTDPASGYCQLVYGFGGGTSFENMTCAGPITAASGVYSQASGWLALTWAWHQLEEIGSEVVWTTRPTITITFG
jgi:hypothetical protein